MDITNKIICDVWGGDSSMDHVARFILATDDALVRAGEELAKGYLVNLRADHQWGEYEDFDDRANGETNFRWNGMAAA